MNKDLKEQRATTLMNKFRAAAHQSVDQWVDQQVGVFAAPKLPTLRGLSQQFMNTRTTLLGGCLEAMITELPHTVSKPAPRVPTANKTLSPTAWMTRPSPPCKDPLM